MGHHILRRVINLTFAFLIAVFSVNISGVLALENAHATNNNGTYVPVWCHLTGNHWSIQQGQSGGANSWALLMTNAIRALGVDAVDTSVPNGSQVKENDRSDKITESDCAIQFTLTAPTPTVTGVCGLNNDTVVVPSSSNYTSSFGGWAANKGTVTVNAVSPYVFTGNKTTVTIPVTELNTAACIVNDATASVTIITPATCSSNSVAIANVSHATLNGTLSSIAGAHTATFTANAGHAFAGGSTTLNVDYTISPTVTGELCAGQKPADKTETRVITNNPVCSPNGGGTVTSWTEQRTHTSVISGNAWVDGPWSDWTKVGSDTTRPATYVECPIHVTPAAPTMDDECGKSNDRYFIHTTAGVVYKVGSTVKTQNANGYQTNSDVIVTAYPLNDNYRLDGMTSWPLDFSQDNCPAPTTKPQLVEVCGTEGDRFVIASSEGVEYKVSKFGLLYTDISAGSHWGAGTFYVKAVAKTGYELTGDKQWTLYLNPNACDAKATAPTRSEEVCGTEHDFFTIPTSAHVTYKKLVGYWLNIPLFPIYEKINAGDYAGNGTVTIKAFADENYTIPGTDKWTFNFDSTPCDTVITPEEPTIIEKCGTNRDGYILPEQEGVTYSVTGNPADGYVEITATANKGFVFAEGAKTQTWPIEFDNTVCPPCHSQEQPPILNDPEFDLPLYNISSFESDEVELPTDCIPNPVQTPVEADPAIVDVCGTNADSFTIEPKTGVIYKWNGNVLTGAGPHLTNGALSVTITAEAEPGYVLTGPTSWTYTFTDTVCVPGRGNAGGTPPTTTTPAGIELPMTGANTNPVQQLLTVIVAGIFTYGAMFYLVNRRDLAKK